MDRVWEIKKKMMNNKNSKNNKNLPRKVGKENPKATIERSSSKNNDIQIVYIVSTAEILQKVKFKTG